MFYPVFNGFFVALSLIIAIGAQNAFVLKQGIIGRFLLPVVLLCVIMDITLISAGVYGIGYAVSKSPIFLSFVKWGGFAFLIIYGLMSFKDAFKKNIINIEEIKCSQNFVKVITALLAISLLNPHVYLDTVLLIGAIGGQFQQNIDKLLFIIGAALASFLWFFSLCYGANYFSNILQKPKVWSFINILTGVIMFVTAFSLIFHF